MKKTFDLTVQHRDVRDVLRFAQGLVMASRCSSLSLAALLLEASELAILSCKDQWPFSDDKDLTFDDLRFLARSKALAIYNNGGINDGSP
jgi:hypothetical protein